MTRAARVDRQHATGRALTTCPQAEPHCAAVDLNLGCPLPGALEGGFGAYMLVPERRSLLLSIVAAMSQAVAIADPSTTPSASPTPSSRPSPSPSAIPGQAVAIPVCCKIRLLDTVEETVAAPRNGGCTPHVTEAAPPCDGGCSPMWRRLQP